MTEKLTFALSAHNEPPVPCQRPSYQNLDSFRLTCYACGELGHIFRNCTSGRNGGRNQNPNQNQRTQNNIPNGHMTQTRNVNFYRPRNLGGQNPAQPCPPAQAYHRPGNVNYCGLDEDTYKPEGELEAYITPTARHEPYPPPRSRGRPRKSESQVEERLRANLPVVEISVPVLAQENEYSLSVVEETSLSRIRRKREPSVIDKLVPYDMSNDIISLKANVTLGQMLQYPDQRQKLAKVLKRPLLPLVPVAPPLELMETHTVQENSSMDLEDVEDEGTFDEFEFEDELLEEAEGYFTGRTSGIELFENLWEDCNSPATYLAHVEELPSSEPDPEEESLEAKLERSMCSSSLPLEQWQTDALVHEIDTGSAVPVKKTPYRAAPSVREFIRKEVEELKKK
ncbi:17619_t:CDS:2, partial [Cetraspora pellucida]